MDSVEGQEWRTRVFLSGVSRCHDYTNLDFIKHKSKYPETLTAVYSKFGILSLFSPYRPDGTYLLNLNIPEEKTVAKMLCELCKVEGWANMTEIKVHGKAVEKMSNEVIKSFGEKGSFECRYVCPPAKVKLDAREKLGGKYLEWTVDN